MARVEKVGARVASPGTVGQILGGYRAKYLVMICLGHVPVTGVGVNPYLVNKDTRPFLKLFLPKGKPLNRRTMLAVVKHFHFAFKGMDTDEIYDVLMEQFVAAINGYDPLYKEKVRKVAETIDHELSKRKQFRVADVGRYLDFDCSKHIRLLVRRGFLEVVPGAEDEEGRFQRLCWPPTPEFFAGDGNVIGLAYYLQTWFRFKLQEWISSRSRELEAKEGVYFLEGWNATTRAHDAGDDDGGESSPFLEQVLNISEDFRDDHGTVLSAGVGMLRKPLDIPESMVDQVGQPKTHRLPTWSKAIVIYCSCILFARWTVRLR